MSHYTFRMSVLYVMGGICVCAYAGVCGYEQGNKKGYEKGVAEGKKLVVHPSDTKESIYTGEIPVLKKASPDVLPWENRNKLIKHMKDGETAYISNWIFYVAENGHVRIDTNSAFVVSSDKYSNIKLDKTKDGYEIWLNKEDKYSSPTERDQYMRAILGGWETVQKIHFIDVKK